MLRIFYNKRAQSILEYAMLIIIISTAIIAMQYYMQRSINARMKQVQEELSESSR